MKFIKLCCIIFIISSCTKVQPPPVINLGKEATATSIEKVFPPITTGAVTIELTVTPGAKYSLQLIDMKGDVKSATGFTADSEFIIKHIDYSDVNSGDYSVVLIDISGKEYKRNLTIKK